MGLVPDRPECSRLPARIGGIALNALSFLVATAWLAAAGIAHAGDQIAEVPPAVTARILATFKERFPDQRVDGVQRAPLAGLFEVFTGDQLVYMNEAADLLFVGKIIDPKTKEDLSLKSWNRYNAIDFSTLPFDLAIKIVKGDGSRTLAIFEDPRCPYCKQLEQQMQKLTNVTVYTFLYPLEEIHPGATDLANRIWCSKDQAGAWSSWMLNAAEPGPLPALCDTSVVTKLSELGTKLRINSTPTLFFADGTRARGAMSAQEIESALSKQGARVANQGGS